MSKSDTGLPGWPITIVMIVGPLIGLTLEVRMLVRHLRSKRG